MRPRRSHISTPFPRHPIFLLLFLLFIPFRALAAFEDFGSSLRQRSLGVTLAADADNVEGRSANPSAGAFLTGWNLAVAGGRQFGLTELSEARVDAGFGTGPWVVGISGFGLGDRVYRERSGQLSLSRRLFPSLAIGAGVRHERLEIEGYGSDGRTSLSVGLLYRHRLADFSLAASHLLGSEIESFSLPSPEPAVIAALMLPLPGDVRLRGEGVWRNGETLVLHFGVETPLARGVTALAGYASETERIHIGLLISAGRWIAGTGMDHHPLLGWSRTVGLLARGGVDAPVH